VELNRGNTFSRRGRGLGENSWNGDLVGTGANTLLEPESVAVGKRLGLYCPQSEKDERVQKKGKDGRVPPVGHGSER